MFGGIASLVPFVGAALVWGPAVIGLVFVGAYSKALALGLWASLVVGSLDNILRPWIVGARDRHNPVLIGLAMLGGTYALGPLGLFLGPLAVSLTGAVIEEIHRLSPVAEAASPSEIDDKAEQSRKIRRQISSVLAE
jgi:predicted PurR-regulated permease PerM